MRTATGIDREDEMGGLPEDDVTRWRHELADLEAVIGTADEEPWMRERYAEIESRIADVQNPLAAPPEVVDADPEDFKPSGRDLVVAPGSGEQEVFRVFDAHDERQILEEMQRKALRVMLYDFGEGRNRKVDLSYQGVNECVRLLNSTGKVRIRVHPQSAQVERIMLEDREYVKVRVYAEDEVTGYGQFGTSMEPVYMKVSKQVYDAKKKDGWPVREDPPAYFQFDEFAETKALNKAQRNALKVHIPEQIRQALIAHAKQDPTILATIQHGAGAEAMAELPAPLDSAEAKALTEEIRGLYVEIRREPGGIAGAMALLPGQFNAKLSRAAHDMALLESLRDELQSRLEHLRGPAVVAGEQR